ncbi:MAG TPA: efflux RND transporter permease subunit [Candidatus Tumulicola sp.]|nr:efflux RND transporter permease subunit [Candidatus Tumulicola sp.]
MWLTRFAIKQPTIVTLFFVAIALFGVIGYFSMGVNINPNVQFPFINVFAVYPGASPQEIERLVIRPIEDELQGVRHVEKITARAQEGSGIIGVQLKLGANVDFGAIDVQQAIDAARVNLPSDLIPPIVTREDPNAQPIMTETITSSKLSPVELSNLVQYQIVPALKGVQGVGFVAESGQYVRQVTVNPDPARLQILGATLLDVSSAVAQGNVSLPGGRLDQYREATMGVRADITDPAQIAQLSLSVPGASMTQLRVGDVAKVVDSYQDHRLASDVNNNVAVVLNIAHDSDADTARTTARVRDEFKILKAKYPDVQFNELVADATFLGEALSGVFQNLGEGILLTALVLLFFLHLWRSALVVMVAIPTSLLATFLLMWILGFSIDLLSLMGLSLTIGILVDDSIVVIENITRHREMGKPAEEAAIVGRSEIGTAAIAITLVDVVVFTPIAFMGGIVGQFLREYGLVIVTATMFSLLVSFTLTPLLAAKWAVLRKPKPSRWGFVRAFTAWFDRVRVNYHDKLLPWAQRHPYLVIFGSVGLVVASLATVASGIVPFEFQPNTEYGWAVASLTYRVGTPIDVTSAGAHRLERELLKRDDVQDVIVNVGQDNNDVNGGYVANLQVNLKASKRHNEHQVVEAIRGMGNLVPGGLIEAGGAQNGGGADLVYTLSGQADELFAAADKLAAYIKKIPNTIGVKATSAIVGPRLEVNIDRDRSALLGVSPQAAATTARAAVAGVIATKLRMPDGLVDTLVQFSPAVRNDESQIRTAQVRASDGTLVPLADVAHFRWVSEPPTLRRQDRQRIVRVFASTVGGAPIGPIDEKVKKVLAQPGFLPPGVSVKAEGEAQFLGDTVNKIGIALLTSFVLIYMLLVILYRNYLTPWVIMFSIPVALIGALGILTVSNLIHGVLPDVRYFAGQTLNIFSMLGIVMLMGLVAKNGILLVDYANTLHTRGLGLVEAMRESAVVRFRPIVMTTAAMILGMLPLAIGITEGAEFRKSMGTVIIGGLISSLLLTLFLVPVWYVVLVGWVERIHAKRMARRLAIAEPDEELAGSPSPGM